MRTVMGVLMVLVAAGTVFGAADDFPLPDGTTWCFLGDSITAANLHTNYIEAYYHLRFPQYQYHFRQCGRGGSTLPEAIERFDSQIIIWSPDVVSLEMGFNGNQTKAEFTTDLGVVTDKTVALGAESVYFSLHPKNQVGGGSTQNDRADAFVEVGAARNLVTVDQFHDLLPIWEANLAAPTPVDLGYDGDGVHPGAVGHLLKTWEILTSMGAPAEVSSARFDGAAGTVLSSSYCTVTNVAKTATGISFHRTDERMPIAFDDEALPALQLVPTLLDDISAYILKVENLAPGEYKILIDGEESGRVTAAQLAAGYNMTEMTAGPIHDQLQLVRQLIRAKEGDNQPGEMSVSKARSTATNYYNAGYRGEDLIAKVANYITGVNALDVGIHQASQPIPHDFEVVLVPEPATVALVGLGAMGLLRRRRP